MPKAPCTSLGRPPLRCLKRVSSRWLERSWLARWLLLLTTPPLKTLVTKSCLPGSPPLSQLG